MTRLGYLVLGFLAVSGGLGLVATVSRFGIVQAVRGAALPAVCAGLPLVLWVGYRRRPPRVALSYVGWVTAFAGALAWLLRSPAFYWAGLIVVVLGLDFVGRAARALLDFSDRRRGTRPPAHRAAGRGHQAAGPQPSCSRVTEGPR